MKARVIREEICKLVECGDTSYENCERLVLLHKALKCLEEDQPESACEEFNRTDSL